MLSSQNIFSYISNGQIKNFYYENDFTVDDCLSMLSIKAKDENIFFVNENGNKVDKKTLLVDLNGKVFLCSGKGSSVSVSSGAGGNNSNIESSSGDQFFQKEKQTKKAKKDSNDFNDQNDNAAKVVAAQGPLNEMHYSVPVESIVMFTRLMELHRTRGQISLLYGPRQYGKTTTAIAVGRELIKNYGVHVLNVSLGEERMKDNSLFWNWMASNLWAERNDVHNATTFSIFVSKFYHKWKKPLFIIVDEFDLIFGCPNLLGSFLELIREIKTRETFYGFLGVGNYQLTHLVLAAPGRNGSPFNLGESVQAVPFEVSQMLEFFATIRFGFTDSLKNWIMEVSGGAPGVFGSLIRFAIDTQSYHFEAAEWVDFFYFDEQMNDYMSRYNCTYHRIKNDIEKNHNFLPSINLLLQSQYIISPAPGTCNDLLLMGIAMTRSFPWNGALYNVISFSSSMMSFICTQVLQTRLLTNVPLTLPEDPIDLLALALTFVNPAIICDVRSRNYHSPSEAVFHFELYAVYRSLLQGHNQKLIPEAIALNDGLRIRCDLLFKNGARIGKELKVGLLKRADMEEAAKQAQKYKQTMNIEKMYVINFVLEGHTVETAYFKSASYPEIVMVLVWHNAGCNNFKIVYLNDQNQEVERILKVQ